MKKYNVTKINTTTGTRTKVGSDLKLLEAKQKFVDCINEYFDSDFLALCDATRSKLKHNGICLQDLITKEGNDNYTFSFENLIYKLK